MGLIREIRFDAWKGEFELGEKEVCFVWGRGTTIGRIGIFFGIVLRKGDFILRIFVFN